MAMELNQCASSDQPKQNSRLLKAHFEKGQHLCSPLYSGGGCRARRRSTLRLSKAPTMPTAIVKHKKEDSRGRYVDTRCLPHRGRTAPADSRRSLPTYGEARRGPGM